MSSGFQQSAQNVKANNKVDEKIELLSVDLLDQNRGLVEDLKRLAKSLRLEFGWHYLLDMTWAIQNLGVLQGKTIMDAGAGMGIMQWYLAEAGAKVISVDRMSRAHLPLRFRKRFNTVSLRPEDLKPGSAALAEHLRRPLSGPFYKRWSKRIVAIARDLFSRGAANRVSGQVLIYNQDLSRLVDLTDNSIDAAVAISSLEHNSKEGLELVVAEVMRVLKPGGALIATLTAARDDDWWHEASAGWCYTDTSLRQLFHLSDAVLTNYPQYDEFFEKLKNSTELRSNLARFYVQSTDKGMPKGIWNPEYQPVGVIKIKKAEAL